MVVRVINNLLNPEPDGYLSSADENFGNDDDTVTATGGSFYLIATFVGNDTIDMSVVERGPNTILCGSGNDRFTGSFGEDELRDGTGNDTAILGNGDDWWFVGAGNDVVDAGAGVDVLNFSAISSDTSLDVSGSFDGIKIDLAMTTAQNFGTFGFDTIRNFETVLGTQGNDTIHGTNRADRLDGNGGKDVIYGRGGNDKISGDDGFFRQNDDRLDGGAGDDELDAWAGNDELVGGAGKDVISGGTGNDRLTGGLGADKLIGGADGLAQDSDRYIYLNKLEGMDTIFIFDATDFFQFEGSAFKLGTYSGTLKAANFVSRASGHTAGDANDFFIFDKKLDQLWFDDDGKGAHKAVMIADLSNDFNLTVNDILIV
jgi:Ca2+-binding RTX toxin-like protein